MIKDNACQQAEQKIEQARRENAKKMNLSDIELQLLPDSLGNLA